MFRLNETTQLEYVDELWLHIHTNFGMYSAQMNSHQFRKFVAFLTECLVQRDNTEEWKRIGALKIASELDEDHFNIFIDDKGSRIIIGMDIVQLHNLVLYFRETLAAAK